MPDLREQLQNHFGLDDFRVAQREVIEDVLAGRDVLCVMPTGAGKSLCYQLPAVAQSGLTIVVSPLIALMEDQVQQLRDEDISAVLLNSSLSPTIQREVVRELEDGFDGLLYLAPERFSAPNFQPVVKKMRPNLLAIDEAHCISQWGHDFRPEYSRLGEVRRRLGSPTTIALTATATEDVRQDIIRQLGLRDPRVVITGFDRPNLIYESRTISKALAKDEQLLELLREDQGSGIIYCSTRKTVDFLAMMLSQALRGRLVVPYHAGMYQSARQANQERFMQSPRSIAVATNAFGMGINKPDIRFVIHYNVPGTLEAYYQEAGRAGRDGQPARCVLLYSFQDKFTQEFFIEKIGENSEPEDAERIARLQEHARRKLELMIRYAKSRHCRRQKILDYFGDTAQVINCQCDACAGSGSAGKGSSTVVSDQVVTLTRQILSAVARLNGRFGLGAVAEVLVGQSTDRSQRWGFEQLSVWGILNRYSTKQVIAMLHRVIEAGLARLRTADGDRDVRLIELTTAGIAVMKSQQAPPISLVDLAPRARGSRASKTKPRALGTYPRALREAAAQPDNELATVEIDMDPQAIKRFERLCEARSRLARDQQLPAFCICHDATLKLIARAAPHNVESLERIKGMGPTRVRMYGEAILAALRTS